MQLEAEELAKRIMPEIDNRARVKKLFQVIYGRDASEEEVKLGLDYIKSEPMLSYEERKKKEKEKPPAEGMRRGRGPGGGGPPPEVSKAGGPPTELAAKVEMPPAAEEASPPPLDGNPAAMRDNPFGMGMMGGMRGGPAREEKPVVYEPSIWGRYAKVLLSSSEFLFVN